MIQRLLFSILIFAPRAISCSTAKDLIELFLPKNPIILEAGAHKGFDTVEMKKAWPTAEIYAVEPLPEVFEELVKNTSGLPGVHCYPVALSDKKGTAKFYVSSGTSDCSSSLLMPKDHLFMHPTVYFKTVIDVETITLDEWAADNNISWIDCMWLDMQGHEYAMLKASPKLLKTVSVIWIEASYNEIYQGCALFPEVRQWLECQGFRYICEIEENALFVRHFRDMPL